VWKDADVSMAQRPWEIRVKVAEQYLKFLISDKK
jgi:hypothetical protein